MFKSYIHKTTLYKIKIGSGVDYIKEVLFWGMTAGGETVMMRTEQEVVQSVEWNKITYEKQADDVVLQVANGSENPLYERTNREKCILYTAVVKTGFI